MTKQFSNEKETIHLEIADDNYTAYLTIQESEEFINENDIISLIEQSSISYGIEQAIEYMQENEIKKEINKPFPIAIGQKTKEPEVEFSTLFNTEQSYHPALGNQFHLLKNLVKIKAGEPVAHLFVSKPSKSGYNIFGEEVSPENTEQQIIENYLGENVQYSMDRGQILSKVAGYPWVDELSRVHVKSEFIIDKDMDLTIEHFDFFGHLIVKGDIKDKIQIKIDGDLDIEGDINDASVEVTGNILVKGNILNCRQGGVIADGNIQFDSSENSRIACGGKISFTKNAHFCRLMAEKGIFGQEEGSAIVGGIAQSGEHIEASMIGNAGMMSTETEISISPYTKEKMLLLTKHIMRLREIGQSDSDEFFKLSEKLQDLEAQLEDEINRTLKNEDQLPKHILAYKKVFPGVYIRILKKSMNVSEEMKSVSFAIIDGDLAIDEY